MEYLKYEKPINNKYWIPKYPLKVFFSLLLFSLLLIPNCIWASIKSLLTKKKDVRGQVILITGTARGLGRELALAFHRLGAKIVCIDIDEEGNTETAALIHNEGGIAKSFTMDVSDRAQIRLMHEAVKEELGPVDILVNNAAIVRENVYANPDSDDLVKHIINVNLLSQFWMNKEILPSMLDRNRGQIVAISSLISLIGTHSASAYTASKWGVTGMMESLDQELHMLNSNVVTTTVCPYFIDSNSEITKNISLSFSVIPLHITCENIVNGILKNKKLFTVPSCLYLAAMFYKILPSKLQYYLQNTSGISYKYSKSDYEVLKKYQK